MLQKRRITSKDPVDSGLGGCPERGRRQQMTSSDYSARPVTSRGIAPANKDSSKQLPASVATHEGAVARGEAVRSKLVRH